MQFRKEKILEWLEQPKKRKRKCHVSCRERVNSHWDQHPWELLTLRGAAARNRSRIEENFFVSVPKKYAAAAAAAAVLRLR